MSKLTRFIASSVAAGAVLLATSAAATTLTTRMSVDNGYIAYISTSNSVQGTQFGSGNDWQASMLNSTVLTAGVDYYLHVYAYDQGGIAGLLGDFSLDSDKHKFANGQAALTTNTVNWSGNNTGFNGVYTSVGDLGADGIGPWGNRPGIADTARWIWAGNANSNDHAYFTTKITAVPEPGSMTLFGLGLAGLAALRRKKAAR